MDSLNAVFAKFARLTELIRHKTDAAFALFGNLSRVFVLVVAACMAYSLWCMGKLAVYAIALLGGAMMVLQFSPVPISPPSPGTAVMAFHEYPHSISPRDVDEQLLGPEGYASSHIRDPDGIIAELEAAKLAVSN